jgi:predicted adenylyl cyclase CyaB
VKEIEIRFVVKNLEDATRRLIECEYTLVRPQGREMVEFYDNAIGANLHGKGRYLRLTTHSDAYAALTYKGENLGGEQAKIREEIETEIDDPNAMRKILVASGLRRVGYYSLSRSLWKKNHVAVTLDRTPTRCFLEIEAKGLRPIGTAARELGLSQNPVEKRSYYDFLRMEC